MDRHRVAYKIVGHFFGLSYLNKSGNNQVENSFLESVTFHARMLSSEVARSYGHFSDLVVEIAMLNFSGKANTSIHGLGEDDTARHMGGVPVFCSGQDYV